MVPSSLRPVHSKKPTQSFDQFEETRGEGKGDKWTGRSKDPRTLVQAPVPPSAFLSAAFFPAQSGLPHPSPPPHRPRPAHPPPISTDSPCTRTPRTPNFFFFTRIAEARRPLRQAPKLLRGFLREQKTAPKSAKNDPERNLSEGKTRLLRSRPKTQRARDTCKNPTSHKAKTGVLISPKSGFS